MWFALLLLGFGAACLVAGCHTIYKAYRDIGNVRDEYILGGAFLFGAVVLVAAGLFLNT